MLNEKTNYEMNYNDGIIIAEVITEKGEHNLGLWYKISEDYCQISFMVGFKIANCKKDTIEKEILRLIENGYLDQSIEIIITEESYVIEFLEENRLAS